MSTLTTIQSTDLITNSRADINNNFSALNTDKMETSVLDTDTTLAANSDAKVATQKAVKAYVDNRGAVRANCRVYQTGGTSLGTADTFYVMDFAGESFDNDTMHSNVSNPSRITFTTAGKYLVGGSVWVAANEMAVGIKIRVDGATDIAGTKTTETLGINNSASVSTLYSFTAGQYIEFLAVAESNGATTSGDTKTNAWAIRVD